MQLTKKQVKALLEVIGSDESRPILTHAKIDMFDGRPVLVATDSYHLCALSLSDEVLPIMGYLIPRAELIKWCKLADARKDYLTDTALQLMAVEDNGGFKDEPQYPKWQNLIPGTDEIDGIPSVGLNAEYMLHMQILADDGEFRFNGLSWDFYGYLSPVIARHNSSLFVVMPIKK